MKKISIQKIKDQIFSNNFQDLIEEFKIFASNDSRFWKHADKWSNNLIKNYNQISVNHKFNFNILGKFIRHINIGHISLNELDECCLETYQTIVRYDNYYSAICIGMIQDKNGPQLVIAFYDDNSRNKAENCVRYWSFVNPKIFKQLCNYGFIDILN